MKIYQFTMFISGMVVLLWGAVDDSTARVLAGSTLMLFAALNNIMVKYL